MHDELEEVSKYLNKENLNSNFIQEISEFKTKLENNIVQRLIPVFIPLHQYNHDVCEAINRIIKESNTHELNREYFIFTNVSKLNTLTPLKNINHLNIIEVPDSVDLIQKNVFSCLISLKKMVLNIFFRWMMIFLNFHFLY